MNLESKKDKVFFWEKTFVQGNRSTSNNKKSLRQRCHFGFSTRDLIRVA